jgi:hypothetical protein
VYWQKWSHDSHCFRENPVSCSLYIHNNFILDYHQIELCFQLVGSPSLEEINELVVNSNAKEYLRMLAPTTVTALHERLPAGTDPRFVDLLQRLLQIKPENRIPANQLLHHPFLFGMKPLFEVSQISAILIKCL